MILFLVLSWGTAGHGALTINEFMAASSERRLHWDAAGVPRVGSGADWMDPGFVPSTWPTGLLPAGYGFSGLATDLTSVMKDKTPTLYLRKEFVVSEAQAADTNALVLSVQYNDGVIVWLNGREVTRLNCGPTNHYVFAGQPAYNVTPGTNVFEFGLGAASARLTSGVNLLAIQAANAEQPSTTNDTSRITRHLPTPEFLINAGLAIVQTNGTRTDLIKLGRDAGAWRYYVGRAEPSGGVVDNGLITRVFSPPIGEEDDYDQPSEFADWVELHNNGPTQVDLSGWFLSDDPDDPQKWRFPTNTLSRVAAGGYLLVLCDDREEANPPAGPASFLHASFKLSDSPGYVGLHDPAGGYVDAIAAYPSQTSFCSYGRRPGDPTSFGHLTTATPGAANTGDVFEGRVEPPEFESPPGIPFPGGFYTNSSVTLYLRTPAVDAQIRYTLNGSEPTEWNGATYSGPVTLSQAVEKTAIVIRARAFRPGWVPSKVKTATYFLKRPSLLAKSPVVALTADAGRDFYAPEGILAIVGGYWNTIWLQNGPQSYNMPIGNGNPFERAAYLEYYFPAGYYSTSQEPLRTTIGVRVSSSPWSRPRLKLTGVTSSPWANDATQKPSLNFHFNGDFADPVSYTIFTNYTVKDYETLRLRAGKNDIKNPFIIDEFMRRLYLDMGHVGSRGLFCTLWLNGVYKGIFNLCERFREPFFQEHYRSEYPWDVSYIGSWVSGDSTALSQLLTALDKDLTNSLNWQAVTNRIDIENAADYYLLNIFGATWDWPGNNYVIARERSTGPLSRFRFGVWDAEGAFKIITSTKPVNYNTITNDLILQPGASSYNSTLPRIFRRLAASPEFRLFFADRINYHMFNQGVLDDQDPDGAGPARSHFLRLLDSMVLEAGDLVRYASGQTILTNGFHSWIAPGTGRRSYLLGNTAGRQMFRESGFWPLTEPPRFNQHGGSIAPGFALEMSSSVATTGQTATIYYTLNGTDPRLAGGAVNSAAFIYSTPVPLAEVTSVRARARNDTTGEWSPLTAATFAPGAEPASWNNLVIAEMMYHPPDATVAEEKALHGNADDFEFLRLMNIGSAPIDLEGVRFVEGVTFDFSSSPVRYLPAGKSILVVANLGAFQFRYGHASDGMIAGVYTGNLANSGEMIRLADTNGFPICAFIYDDDDPWPMAADGDGPSLVLRDPWTNPNPDDAASWTTSAMPGGMPLGTAPAQTFQRWRELTWSSLNATNELISGSAADPDLDGLSNLLEYALGLNPRHLSPKPQITPSLEELADSMRLVLMLRVAPGASKAQLTWEKSQDLVSWSPTSLELLESISAADGSATVRYADSEPLSGSGSRFIRLRVVLLP